MKLCTDTITVVNKAWDDDKGYDVYVGTVIRGVRWHGRNQASVDDKGLHSANIYTIRIPDHANFSGKTYVDPMTYRDSDPAKTFTLADGDTVVHGEVDTIITRPSDLQEQYAEVVTVIGVTNNMDAPRAKHFHVECK